MERLLDSIVEEVDDKAKFVGELKKQQALLEKNQLAAVENIRNHALKRNAQSIESSTTEKVQFKRKKAEFENNLLNFCNSNIRILLIEEVRAHLELELKRL